jgi:hypothetical protein
LRTRNRMLSASVERAAREGAAGTEKCPCESPPVCEPARVGSPLPLGLRGDQLMGGRQDGRSRQGPAPGAEVENAVLQVLKAEQARLSSAGDYHASA